MVLARQYKGELDFSFQIIVFDSVFTVRNGFWEILKLINQVQNQTRIKTNQTRLKT